MGTSATAPRIVPIDGTADEAMGGKAQGLARLVRIGLSVPEGFVIEGARPGVLPRNLADAYRGIGGGLVAVRSSASGEDGPDASAAGQYETVLDVRGAERLAEAVESCLASLTSDRALAYRGHDDGAFMSIVVQRMVAARAAGVIFTADPVSMTRDRVSIEAVEGKGERLVSGRARPDRYVASRDGSVLERETGERAVLDDTEIGRLVGQALEAEREWGAALDLEWAIDVEGRLYWLQARTITTPVDRGTSLDAHQGDSDVYTRFNVGEMMPGAVCPLTLSTSVRGIDHAIQNMMVAAGVRPAITDSLATVGVFGGHVFLNLSSMLEFCTSVAGNSPERMGQTVCGREVPELGGRARAPAWTRIRNGVRFGRWVLGAGRRVEEMEGRLGSFAIGTPSDPGRAHAEIGRKLPVLFEMYDVHIQSSAVSGLMGGVLTQVLSGGSAPTPEDDAEVAGLLARAGGLASGEIVLDLEGLVLELASNPESVDRLVGADPRDALDWLRTGPSRTCFERFLERHGHRTLVELDMRRPSWADDPIPLVTMLGASVSAKLGRRAPLERRRVQPLRPGPAMRWLVRMTKDAVRGRERSKSLLVEYTDRFKKAYGHLAGLMVDRGLLPEVDALYFLTHEELGRLGSDPSLALLSATRRREHARNGRLEFAEISTGCPVPLEWRGGGADELCGKPVSRGVARGRARVVRSPEEAVGLEEGEILIAPHTDVGWTPYFSVIAGVGTEVGSAFCHGAVIAREYGLPAVVNLENATRLVRTGDMVLLDGDRGILRRLAE